MNKLNGFIETQESMQVIESLNMITNGKIEGNFFFLSGNTGSGQTFLINLVLESIKELNPELNYIHMSASDYTSEMVLSMKSGDINNCQSRIYNSDIIVIENISFIKDRMVTQLELYAVFKSMKGTNKKIIFSDIEITNRMHGFQDCFIDLINESYKVELLPPSLESKEIFLKEISKNKGIKLDSKIISYLAENSNENIRELIGKLIKLSALKEILHSEITMDLVKKQFD
jgi:chromosomal replication initiator protein